MRQRKVTHAFSSAKRDYDRALEELTEATNLLVVSLDSILALGLVVNKATATQLHARLNAVKACLYGADS